MIYRGDCLPCQNRKLVQDKTEKGSGGGLFTEVNLRQDVVMLMPKREIVRLSEVHPKWGESCIRSPPHRLISMRGCSLAGWGSNSQGEKKWVDQERKVRSPDIRK